MFLDMLLKPELSTGLLGYSAHMQNTRIALCQCFHRQAAETHPAKQTSFKF